MSKLWAKGYELDKVIERFTVGDDYLLDQELVYYDCVGSMAHAAMLMHADIITPGEYQQLKKALISLIHSAENKQFAITISDEDVHTAVENWLIQEIGDLGKKLHTARSRNDQIILDLRLFMRDQLLAIANKLLNVAGSLLVLAEEHKEVPVAGRTHFQRAMPSSLGLFWAAYAESLLDTVVLIQSAYELVNQCPLGSAASYGVIVPIDRALVSDLLGFRRVQNNVLYVNNSRGKFESIILNALMHIILDVSKLCGDMIIFSAPEFGYMSMPEELCSGSSLMPQKRNPCVLELIRAKSATVIGYLMQTLTLIRGLPSGYNRDFQETKKPLMECFSVVRTCLEVADYTLQKVSIDRNACLKSITPDIFATDHALRLVKQGHSFRDAYKQVAHNVERIPLEDPIENIRSKTHQGAPGNLGLALSHATCKKYRSWVERSQKYYERALGSLMEEDQHLPVSPVMSQHHKGTSNDN